MSLIELKNINKTYHTGKNIVRALVDVSLTIEKGEFVAIMGPSGSGKSTLLHLLGLLDTADSGEYLFDGIKVGSLSDNKLAALRNSAIGFVFQHFNLLARTNALENVLLPRLYSERPRDKKDALKLLEKVGLADRAYHKSNELSGGQQQRVAIARALINSPSLILADEPTGNLDSASSEEIMKLLKGLNEEGITVVIVTHEPDIARWANRQIKMRDGVIKSDQLADKKQMTISIVKQTEDNSEHKIKSLLYELPDHIKQAIRALLANKVRTFLSMLGILIGVAAVIAMLAIGAGAKMEIEKQLASMGSNLLITRAGSPRLHGVALQAGATARLTLDDIEEIKKRISSVKKISGTIVGRGQLTWGGKNWNTQLMGVHPEYAEMRASQAERGRFFNDNELRSRARVAVVGLTVVKRLFGEKDPIGEYIKINKIPFQVIGIQKEKGATGFWDQDDVVLIPISTAMYRVFGREYIDSIETEIVSEAEISKAEENIKEVLLSIHRVPPSMREDAFNVRNMAEFRAMLTQTSRTMSTLLSAIAAVSLLVGGIGIMNIMLVSVTERTREIGLRKAVGAKRRDILAQFLTEALTISLLGGVIGILIGWIISHVVTYFAGWATSITFFSVLLAISFSMFVGIVFGLWPAMKAARQNPIEALRYE